jgi:hypothetical protein
MMFCSLLQHEWSELCDMSDCHNNNDQDMHEYVVICTVITYYSMASFYVFTHIKLVAKERA